MNPIPPAKEINIPGKCKHELDKSIPLIFDPKYGRIGVCKLCKRPVVYVKINFNPQRERFKGSKKDRLKSRKGLQDEIRRNS